MSSLQLTSVGAAIVLNQGELERTLRCMISVSLVLLPEATWPSQKCGTSMQLDMQPSQEIISLLRQLTEHHTFFLVSGRVHEDMEQWFLKVRFLGPVPCLLGYFPALGGAVVPAAVQQQNVAVGRTGCLVRMCTPCYLRTP